MDINELSDTVWINPDYSPYPVCWVELDNGTQIQATYAAGDWETLDGQWVKMSSIKRWSPLRIMGLKGVYK